MKSKKWIIFTVIMLSSVAVAMNQFKIPPIMSALMTKLNVNMTLGGWVMSIYDITIMILVIPSAILINKFGVRRVGLVSLAITAIASFGGAFADTLTLLLISRVCEAVGQALIGVVAPTIIAKAFKGSERGLPMGIWACWVPIAIMIIFNVAAPLQSAYGLSSLWIVTSVITAICFVLFALVVRNVKDPEEEIKVKAAQGSMESKGSSVFAFSTFKNVGILVCCGLFFGSGFRFIAYDTWVPTYFEKALHVSPVTANFFASLESLGLLLGSIFVGVLFDKKVSLRKILLGTQILTILMSLVGFALNTGWIIPNELAIGLLCGSTVNCMWTAVPRLAKNPQQVSMGCALLNLFISFGQLLGAPFAGYLITAHGWYGGTGATELGCGVMIIFAIFLFRIRATNEVKSRTEIQNPSQLVA
jgi:predicted MFS family arabinose efflux permease